MNSQLIKKSVVCILILVFCFLGIWFVKSELDKKNTVEVDNYDKINRNIETVLLIGIDDFSEEKTYESYINTAQADFLFLLIYNNKTQELSALQINRDTICDVTVLGVLGDKVCKEPMQIALSHTYGTGGIDSCQNTEKAVDDLLGISVDHYVAATMDIVAILNDAIGGVTLTPTVSIGDEIIEGQKITLTGDQALEYIRARQDVSDGSNLSRMERQRQYINAAIEQYTELKDFDDTVIANNILSDCSIERLRTIFDNATTFTFTGIETLKGEAIKGDSGYMEYHLDEDELQNTIETLFYKKGAK